jgi:hypothetical protein
LYTVETTDEVSDQVAMLSRDALHAFAELVDLLELHPWSGDAYSDQNPDGNMRAHVFGPLREGLAIYMILEREQRVIMLRVLWLA